MQKLNQRRLAGVTLAAHLGRHAPRRLGAVLALSLLALAGAGCGGGGGAAGGGGSASSGGGEGEGTGGWTVRDTGVAQMDLDMTEAQFKEAAVAAGGEVAPAAPVPEGLKAPVFVVKRGGAPVVYVELRGGKVHRFTTEQPDLMTSYGAAAGNNVEGLDDLYGGSGELVFVDGYPAARFDVAPTLRFVFKKDVKARDWAALEAANPVIWRLQAAENWSPGS